jgi:hypothetical protein
VADVREFLVIALVAYLSGAASAVFLMVVIGIRRGYRPLTAPAKRLAIPDAAHSHRAGERKKPAGPN